MSTDDFAFPLRDVAEGDLQNLGRELWNWQLCGDCTAQPSCSTIQCPWSRAKRLTSFWTWYKELSERYVPELTTVKPALRFHNDLFDIIRLIRARPNEPRSSLMQQYFVERDDDGQKVPDPTDQSRAFNMAVRILFMVNCGISHQYSDDLEYAQLPMPWRSGISISQFITEAFPTSSHPYFDDQSELSESLAIRKTVTALSLKKHAKLRLKPTNDLRNHLRLDRRKGIVEIFHQTAVLKEDLLAGYPVGSAATVGDFISRGNLPRALALETLDTIHKILFPPDQDSQALLSSLVRKASFDEDCLRYESARYRHEDEKDTSYAYWGARLAELHDEVQNPTPRGWFQTRLERKSGARHVMMATLIGVMIAIVIGFLGLAVATFQAWVAWQQWKHPVSAR